MERFGLKKDQELIISGENIIFLLEGLWGLTGSLDKVEIKDKELDEEVELRIVALFIGVVKMMPTKTRKLVVEEFEKVMGYSIDKLL